MDDSIEQGYPRNPATLDKQMLHANTPGDLPDRFLLQWLSDHEHRHLSLLSVQSSQHLLIHIYLVSNRCVNTSYRPFSEWLWPPVIFVFFPHTLNFRQNMLGKSSVLFVVKSFGILPICNSTIRWSTRSPSTSIYSAILMYKIQRSPQYRK